MLYYPPYPSILANGCVSLVSLSPLPPSHCHPASLYPLIYRLGFVFSLLTFFLSTCILTFLPTLLLTFLLTLSRFGLLTPVLFSVPSRRCLSLPILLLLLLLFQRFLSSSLSSLPSLPALLPHSSPPSVSVSLSLLIALPSHRSSSFSPSIVLHPSFNRIASSADGYWLL